MAIDGTWKVEIDTPIGKQEATLTLKTDGDKLSGVGESMMGKNEFTGTVNGDTLIWTMDITSPMGAMKLEYNVKVTGDDMAGEVNIGTFGNAPQKGKRI